MSFVTIVVPDSHVATARDLAACMAPGGHGMFMSALSADGGEPATHWISTGIVQDEFAAVLGDPVVAYQAAQAGAQQQGLTMSITEQDVADLYAVADVTSEDPHAAIARLGLKPVSVIE